MLVGELKRRMRTKRDRECMGRGSWRQRKDDGCQVVTVDGQRNRLQERGRGSEGGEMALNLLLLLEWEDYKKAGSRLARR